MNLDDVEYVTPATNVLPGFLEDAYTVHLNDRTETFSMIPAPHAQWLMEIKSTSADSQRND
jgi:hypothetical protein